MLARRGMRTARPSLMLVSPGFEPADRKEAKGLLAELA
jgi:hypothetical protein